MTGTIYLKNSSRWLQRHLPGPLGLSAGPCSQHTGRSHRPPPRQSALAPRCLQSEARMLYRTARLPRVVLFSRCRGARSARQAAPRFRRPALRPTASPIFSLLRSYSFAGSD